MSTPPKDVAPDSDQNVASDEQHQQQPGEQSAAARKVFETVELLEMILLDVPIFQLFVMQSTSKTIRDTIAGSVKLQRKMWLRPDGDEGTNKTEGKGPQHNPLVYNTYFISELAVWEGWAEGLTLTVVHGNILGFMARKYRLHGPGEVSFPFWRFASAKMRKLPIQGTSGITPSWRRMLATKFLEARCYACFSPFASWERMEYTSKFTNIEGEERLGSLMDKIGDKYDGQMKLLGREDSDDKAKAERRAERATEGQYAVVKFMGPVNVEESGHAPLIVRG